MAHRLQVIILTFLIFITGCSDQPERPKNLIPEDDYIDLLVELQLINSFSGTQLADSLSTDSLIQEVFKKYEVEREQFRRSHNYYQEFPEEQKNRIDKAIERLRMDEVQDTTKTRRRPTSSSDTVPTPTQPSLP